MPCGGSAASQTAGAAAVNSTKAPSCPIAAKDGRGTSRLHRATRIAAIDDPRLSPLSSGPHQARDAGNGSCSRSSMHSRPPVFNRVKPSSANWVSLPR